MPAAFRLRQLEAPDRPPARQRNAILEPPPRGTRILFDEKIGGTVHVALGRSYPETGGKNASALHWDLICDLRQGGRLSADGETIMENGIFAWPFEPGRH